MDITLLDKQRIFNIFVSPKFETLTKPGCYLFDYSFATEQCTLRYIPEIRGLRHLYSNNADFDAKVAASPAASYFIVVRYRHPDNIIRDPTLYIRDSLTLDEHIGTCPLKPANAQRETQVSVRFYQYLSVLKDKMPVFKTMTSKELAILTINDTTKDTHLWVADIDECLDARRRSLLDLETQARIAKLSRTARLLLCNVVSYLRDNFLLVDIADGQFNILWTNDDWSSD